MKDKITKPLSSSVIITPQVCFFLIVFFNITKTNKEIKIIKKLMKYENTKIIISHNSISPKV